MLKPKPEHLSVGATILLANHHHSYPQVKIIIPNIQ